MIRKETPPGSYLEKIDIKVDEDTICRLFKDEPYGMMLDSSLNGNYLGRYSIIVFEPFLVFKSWGMHIEIIENGKTEKKQGHPLEYLKILLNQYKSNAKSSQIPFQSGCAGYFSYDLCNMIEKLPKKAKDANGIPDIVLGFYNNAVIIDHYDKAVYISVTSAGISKFCDMGKAAQDGVLRDKAQKIKTDLLEHIKGYIDLEEDSVRAADTECAEDTEYAADIDIQQSSNCLESDFTKEAYCRMVEKAKEYIRDGDIYQVNLSQRFKIKINEDPYIIYRKLRKVNPAPFSAYMNIDDIKVISSSPERFFKVEGKKIETRPIKGTRPRGSTPDEDEKLKNELLNSEKDRAELTMIVDLERNDLGRVCKIGSVRVDKLMEIEEFATVFHLVSTITGELDENTDIIDCIRAAFPGGSITGAPKIRSMEIIEELEPVRRGIYTGAIGYIDFNGNADLNIAIRTIIAKGNEAFYNVGGGIVWDSVPEKEYDETLDKGKALMKVLKKKLKKPGGLTLTGQNIPTDDMGCLYGFSLFETFLVNVKGSALLLDRHIERLFKSSEFFEFDINFNRNDLELAVLEFIESEKIKDKILRLSVTYGNRSKNIKPSIIITIRENQYKNENYIKGARLSIAKQKKSADSLIIRHKTANYLENFLIGKEANSNGFDDVLFLNIENMVTETTKSNIFFAVNGTIFTPSVDCGLLPGIIRGWVLEKSKSAGITCIEGNFPLDALLSSNEVFLTNSVMGIMPVRSISDYNEHIINNGYNGKLTEFLMNEYQHI